MAAVLRNRIKTSWRFVHWLSYLAFFMVFAHSWLLGSDVAGGALRLAWAAMAAIVAVILVHRRLLNR